MIKALMIDDLLACPRCNDGLEITAEFARCNGCEGEYHRVDGTLDFTLNPPPDQDVLARWDLWRRLEENGRMAYDSDPVSSLSVDGHGQAPIMQAFADLQGTVLDIGCGPQQRPLYSEAFTGRFVGIDPLRGVGDRRMEFVMGLGEYLPFRSGIFDRVLFATSLDHTISRARAISEAARVARSGGQVIIWMSASDSEPAPPMRLPERLVLAARLLATFRFREFADRLARLQADPESKSSYPIPTGAVDAFHIDQPDEEQTLHWLRHAGLTVSEINRETPGTIFIRGYRS